MWYIARAVFITLCCSFTITKCRCEIVTWSHNGTNIILAVSFINGVRPPAIQRHQRGGEPGQVLPEMCRTHTQWNNKVRRLDYVFPLSLSLSLARTLTHLLFLSLSPCHSLSLPPGFSLSLSLPSLSLPPPLSSLSLPPLLPFSLSLSPSLSSRSLLDGLVGQIKTVFVWNRNVLYSEFQS